MRTIINVNFTDAFNESEHPRKGGKFASKGAGNSGVTAANIKGKEHNTKVHEVHASRGGKTIAAVSSTHAGHETIHNVEVKNGSLPAKKKYVAEVRHPDGSKSSHEVHTNGSNITAHTLASMAHPKAKSIKVRKG